MHYNNGMDIASPISSVIPSLDGPVLAALAATTAPLTLTEAHRMTGHGSVAGVRRVLLRLVDAGVVLQIPGGYLANRDHVAWPAVDLLSRLHGSLIERIRQWLAGRPEQIVVAGLFGSAARRDGDERSDIDVIVVSEADTLEDLTDDLAERIRAWTGNPAQVIGMRPADLDRLRRHREPILDEWARDIVVVCGERSVLKVAA
jgi:predicted nucleotidyltransferase